MSRSNADSPSRSVSSASAGGAAGERRLFLLRLAHLLAGAPGVAGEPPLQHGQVGHQIGLVRLLPLGRLHWHGPGPVRW